MPTTKTKIGKGYLPSGYGKTFNPRAIVWNIGGYAFVKDASYTPFETSLEGYTMVNKQGDTFYSIGLKSEHRKLWDTKPKTGIAWLEQTKEHGYGWADSALKQADEDAKRKYGSMYAAVSTFALWGTTVEGQDYWEKLCATLTGI